jgi:hypothetical protein
MFTVGEIYTKMQMQVYLTIFNYLITIDK